MVSRLSTYLEVPMKRKIYGLLAVAVVVAMGLSAITCKKSSNPAAPAGPAADVVIQINGISGSTSFSPNPATVKVGQTVAWHNKDGTTHSATPDAAGFASTDVGSGGTSGAQTITAAAADYGYHCRFHGTMVGTLHVVP